MLTDHATHMGEADWDKLFLTGSALGDEKIIEAGEQTGGKMTAPVATATIKSSSPSAETI